MSKGTYARMHQAIMAPQAMNREQNIKNLKSGLKLFDVMESLTKLNARFY